MKNKIQDFSVSSQSRHGGYAWPEALHPLRQWLIRQGLDAGAVKTDRQALFYALRLARLKWSMPRKGYPCLPLLLKVQEKICGVGKLRLTAGKNLQHPD